jgi:hypothetical protein
MRVKYESLVTDFGLIKFEEIFRFLGFNDVQIPTLKAIALQNSLFSKKRVDDPVRVRSGMPAQWKQEFSPAVLEAFVSLHGDAAERLGYEPSTITALNAKGAQKNRKDCARRIKQCRL